MMKNKKTVLVVLCLILGIVIVLNNSTDEENAVPLNNAKKKKSKQLSYEELKNTAFSTVPDTVVVDLPQNLRDPFKSASFVSKSSSSKSVKRNYSLKGVMKKDKTLFCVIVDPSGESHIVSKGESFNGVTVLKVEEGKALLKDTYGNFTLSEK